MSNGILKPGTNIPVEGTVKYIDKKEGQYGEQLRWKGDFTCNGERGEILYTPLMQAIEDSIVKSGVATTNGDKWFPAKGRVRFTRKEDGNRKFWTFELLDGAPASQSQPSSNGSTNRPASGAKTGSQPAGLMFGRLGHTLQRCREIIREIDTPEAMADDAAKFFIALKEKGGFTDDIAAKLVEQRINSLSTAATSLFIQTCQAGAIHPDPIKGSHAPEPEKPSGPRPASQQQMDALQKYLEGNSITEEQFFHYTPGFIKDITGSDTTTHTELTAEQYFKFDEMWHSQVEALNRF